MVFSKRGERRPRNVVDYEPNPTDVVIGVKAVPNVQNEDGSETVHDPQSYTLADYTEEVQEAFSGLNTKLGTIRSKRDELKKDNKRLVAERDGFAAHVTTLLEKGEQEKKEASESLALIPKLVEKTEAQIEEITRYVCRS